MFIIKILRQLSIILVIWAIGEYISYFISPIIKIPGSIIGMILLFLLLQTKLIKLNQIEEVSNFFLDNIAFFFIPSGVSLINSLGIIKDNILLFLVVISLTTILTIYLTALVIDKMINIKNTNNKEESNNV